MLMYLRRVPVWVGDAWQASFCRGLLQGSFVTRWLIPQEAAPPVDWAVTSRLGQGGQALLRPLLKLLWWLGEIARGWVSGSYLLALTQSSWRSSLVGRGLDWWRRH